MKNLIRSITSALFFGLMVSTATAEDKSASSIVQLPSAGGTVTREEGTFGPQQQHGFGKFQVASADTSSAWSVGAEHDAQLQPVCR